MFYDWNKQRMEENTAEGPHSLHSEGGREALWHCNECGDSSARPTNRDHPELKIWPPRSQQCANQEPVDLYLGWSIPVYKPSQSFFWPFEVLEHVEFRKVPKLT